MYIPIWLILLVLIPIKIVLIYRFFKSDLFPKVWLNLFANEPLSPIAQHIKFLLENNKFTQTGKGSLALKCKQYILNICSFQEPWFILSLSTFKGDSWSRSKNETLFVLSYSDSLNLRELYYRVINKSNDININNTVKEFIDNTQGD